MDQGNASTDLEETNKSPQLEESNQSTSLADQMEIDASKLCCICQKSTDEDIKLKAFNEQIWTTVRKVATLRTTLKSDKYFNITQKILQSNQESTRPYHPSCHKKYTAVKRPKSEPTSSDAPPAKKPQIHTITCSVLPKDDELKEKCLFCGKTRKKIKGKEEPRQYVRTLGGCDAIRQRVKFSKNERVKGLVRTGVDLIAADAWYHRSCRLKFYLETKDPEKKVPIPEDLSSRPTPLACHKSAFAALCAYITSEVIENQRSVLVSALLDVYKAEYTSIGGDQADVESYLSQNLQRKIKDHYGDSMKVKLADQRRGNFIFSSNVQEDDALARLHHDSEEHQQNDKLRWAALHLRSQIMKLPKFRTPNPATVQNIKECAPDIPAQLDLFFRSLLGGMTPNLRGAHKDNIDRKVTSMASDAIFNATRGTVKPWKHTALGLGLASLTGSKLSLQILNRAGHSISYSETKGLETEFAYSVESSNQTAPDGIKLDPYLATASVWDNNDANVETLDGKATLHTTVGHTYQNVLPDTAAPGSTANMISFREGRNRRKFVGTEHELLPFRKPLKTAKFVSATATTAEKNMKIELKPLDLYWFWRLHDGNTPLHSGFVCKYIKDPLPLQRICYMDPISKSPTNNDVVRETMIRTMSVAEETGQKYAVVTYDLAVALKAYSIQEIERPLFDKLLVMLGNFHIELAFYGAVGNLINESGMEYILTEADVLAEGSMVGFIKGKFYNRCTRIHELVANVLEKKMYQRFVSDLSPEECAEFHEAMNRVPSDPSQMEQAHLEDSIILQHLQKYEDFFHRILDGDFGPTAQLWGIYIFLINRLHRELQRCVKTNDVSGYINVFPLVLDVFFGLNRPNYARWGTLFLQKLQSSNPRLVEVLEKGAFSIRRTKKNYSRSAVDLSLEQSVNRDSASSMKGIVVFRNSESAMRRWAVTMTQRAMAVTELRTFAGLELGEHAASQCRPSRIKKDNHQMASLSEKIDESCNPFMVDAPASLLNLATGHAASKVTQKYLLTTLKRGLEAKETFQEEWERNGERFLQPVKRTKVQNFAAENVKKKGKVPAMQKAMTNAESLRDMFIRMVVLIAEKTAFDLHKVLSFPIITYPLSLAHCDGSLVKTNKSALLNKLEAMQTEPCVLESDLPHGYAQVYDGGLLLHSVISQTNMGATYASIARSILSVVCRGRATEVHVCLDKYIENSIKDSERKLRGAVDSLYIITGPDQNIRQSGQKLLDNGVFKNELGKFLLHEWSKDHYWNILGGKTVIASHGGECFQYFPEELHHVISVTKPPHLQGNHEEADTLIAFHVANITASHIIVRASDTDVLVILIGALGQQRLEVRSMTNIIMDCGMGNSRRYINVSNIANILEESKPGLPRAIPGYHAFTGCDFTSAFYRKGKVKPYDIMKNDETGQFVDLFISMGDITGDIDFDVASEFVCRMYAQTKTRDVNTARYNKLVDMTGKHDKENPLAKIKRVDCALLPPTRQTLKMKIRRTQYVTVIWTQATAASPGDGLLPADYGWSTNENDRLQPIWFEGPPAPDSLFRTTDNKEAEAEVESDSDETIITGMDDETGNERSNLDEVIDSDDDPWSEDSGSDQEDEMD